MVFQLIQHRSCCSTLLLRIIKQKVTVKDINTSIRLIDDECNIYTIVNAKMVKRRHDIMIDIIRWRANVERFKDKAPLCWITKKSPYNVPINDPRAIDNMLYF